MIAVPVRAVPVGSCKKVDVCVCVDVGVGVDGRWAQVWHSLYVPSFDVFYFCFIDCIFQFVRFNLPS